MELSSNHYSSSVLHDLDTRIKVGGLAWLTLWMSFGEGWSLLLCTFSLIFLLFLSKLPLSLYRTTFITLIWLGLFYIFAYGWIITGGLAFWRGYWDLEGIFTAIFTIWKIGIIFFLTRLFMEITPPLEQAMGIAFFMYPLSRLSRLGGDIILLLTLTLRFIPLFIDEGKAIWISRRLKGQWPKSYFKKTLEIARLIPPMLLLSLRRAEEIAENLLARGYNSGNYRFINYREWKRIDSVALIYLGAWALSILISNRIY